LVDWNPKEAQAGNVASAIRFIFNVLFYKAIFIEGVGL